MDRLLLVASTFCFLLGSAYTMFALGARVARFSKAHFVVTLVGSCFQTAFLYVRGEMIGRCPLTNLFEGLIFLSWSMVLFYFIIGPPYRMSVLGAFTAPVVFLLQFTALIIPGIDPLFQKAGPVNPWMELHAAVSTVAYGAFALAGIAGVMYLVQERQLKTHRLGSIFFYLPPIRELALANRRLILTGLILLTVGIGAGMRTGAWWSHASAPFWVWGIYAMLTYAKYGRTLSPRRGSWYSIIAFLFALATLAGLHLIPALRGAP